MHSAYYAQSNVVVVAIAACRRHRDHRHHPPIQFIIKIRRKEPSIHVCRCKFGRRAVS